MQSAADQAIVREVMERTYRNFDEQNLIDNHKAFDALLNAGIESVPIDMDEYKKVREALLQSNRQLGQQGFFTPELYDEMLQYVEEYRNEQQASAGSSN